MRLAGCGAAVAAVLFASTAATRTTKAQPAPKGADFRVEVDGLIVADFSARLAAYAELRKTLEQGLPALAVTPNPAEILSILAALPRLPDDVMYRFLDRDLILHDTRANVILDRIENAIKCK